MSYPGPRHDLLAVELRKVREAAGLSQRDIAARLGRGQSYVCKVETSRQIVSAEELLDWCRVCGVKASEVVKRIEDL